MGGDGKEGGLKIFCRIWGQRGNFAVLSSGNDGLFRSCYDVA